jgi:hypothetical protein
MRYVKSDKVDRIGTHVDSYQPRNRQSVPTRSLKCLSCGGFAKAQYAYCWPCSQSRKNGAVRTRRLNP